MQREQKQEFVKQFNTILKDKEFMLVADYKGLNVSQISSLRDQIGSVNSNFKVAKNTLARMAIKNTNFQILTIPERLENREFIRKERATRRSVAPDRSPTISR